MNSIPDHASPPAMRTRSLINLLVLLIIHSLLGPTNVSAMKDPMLDKVVTAMLTMQRLSWEHATAAQSLYELGEYDLAELMARESALRQKKSGAYDDGYPTDTCAIGEVMVRVGERTQDEDILQAIEKNRNYIKNTLRRAKDGTILHTPEANEVWIDSMYMAPPALAAMGEFDDAVRQIRGMHERLWDNKSQLFHHQYSEDTKSIKGSKLWGVGNGWALMGMARTIRQLPDEYTKEKKEIIGYFKAALDGCLATIRPDGLTHFILTDPSTFVDSGAAPAFAYAVYRGIENGWLPKKKYFEKAEFIRKAVRAKVDEHGFLQDACGLPYWENQSRSVETQSFLILMEAARNDLLKSKK